ncbi:MAG: phage tail sheath subtilisin-like domain-containing protein [Leptolyngbya sp. SIO1E4]|nr:phage tail sheath subtilisin-like domain-containing protein [Leptolyngbya sp. SIO1E4]
MPTYKTPNVYVEEVATLPPSVVPVATAVPAFIGCTEKAGNSNEYFGKPIRISSILDYTTLFGGAYATNITVTVDDTEQITEITRGDGSAVTPAYLMYYTLRLFFENGGGPCYIVSIGSYEDQPGKDEFAAGLAAIRKEDEPTLILLTDAVNLINSDDYYTLCQSALKQCNDLKDRFAIFDVLASDRDTNGIGANFRQGIGTQYLKYGAAYYPYLQTALNDYYTEESVTISGLALAVEPQGDDVGEYRTENSELIVTYNGAQSENPQIAITTHPSRTSTVIAIENGVLTLKVPTGGATVADILAAAAAIDISPYHLAAGAADTATILPSLAATPLTYGVADSASTVSLAALKTQKTGLYNTLKTTLNTMRVMLPPSGAVAGVYAKVDRERGVWKAPANVSLASVIGPAVKVTNEEQDNLNVDPTAGKSINAIRSFTGKGTLIWGARTLAGNDNEWRYIPVRRLFNLIEESTQKATSFVVFESNNAITWLKVKTIIETYLDGLWRQGALAGATPQDAYFVSVGLGQTMTEQDILEGRMIIEIGISAVRPAEFIILRFSHKLQQA